MRALVFTTQALATRVRDRLDALLGYPKQPSHRGANCPANIGATTNCSPVVKHPARNEWAVPVKPGIAERFAAVKAEATARIAANNAQAGDAQIVTVQEITLDATWRQKPAPAARVR